ncbi:MAG TPA: PEGA domain-containing protein [Polyangia bacterium]|nr:PEGA domain-containing protein [Polyangia bacterium]
MAFAIVATSSAAVAAEDPEALIRQGIALRKAGDDAKAQGYFQRAYELAKTPRSAAQLGLVDFALELWPASEEHLAEALRATDDVWIATNRKTLSDSLDEVRGHLGRLTITGSPEGARVVVADVDRGTLPLSGPLYVAPGSVVVAVSADARRTVRRMVEVRAGETTKVDIQVAAPEASSEPRSEPVPEPASEPGGWRRPLAWGTAAGAVVLLSVGTVALVESNHDYAAFNDRLAADSPTQHECSRSLANKGSKDCQQLLSAGDRDKLVAIIGFAAGAAAAVGSAVLFLTSGDSKPSATALSCAPELSHPGAVCAVRF